MTNAIESNLVLAALLVLVCATVVSNLQWRVRTPNAMSTLAALLVTVLLFLGAIVVRWLREEQGPFLTLYDVLLSNLFSLCLIFMLLYLAIPRTRASAAVVLPFLALLNLWLITVSAEAVALPPTFDNSWLWLHVLSGKIFLGLILVPAALSVFLILQQAGLQSKQIDSSDDVTQLDAVIWPLMAYAFVCHSFMLVAGAVWAHSAWGRYWAWDSLETWTLVTWLSIALLLHLRVSYRRLPSKIGWYSVIGIFVLAFLTFFGVPFVSVAPHKGVM